MYYSVFAALMVLTWITVAVAYVDLGALNKAVALGIATVKAVLVILFFMHVKESSRLTKVIVVTGFFFLAILIGLTMSDYATRGLLPLPPSLQ
jgi:cytochrome c oxidase subunit 4